jgi:hypothetical protein
MSVDVGYCRSKENSPVGVHLSRIQEDALATYKDRFFVPGHLQNQPQCRLLLSVPRLTMSCRASLLYGVIHWLGWNPTALAAVSTARHESATTPPSFKIPFMLSEKQTVSCSANRQGKLQLCTPAARHPHRSIQPMASIWYLAMTAR